MSLLSSLPLELAEGDLHLYVSERSEEEAHGLDQETPQSVWLKKYDIYIYCTCICACVCTCTCCCSYLYSYCHSLMSMVKQHRIWLLEVTLMERSGKFLIWVEGLGIGILLFELFVLLTTQRELLNIYILSASLLVFDLFCEFIFQMGSAEA
ncbi:uncharacterized protein LOC114269940 isoform X2 [Camellia sinensis]|uniref:uncharacterized protein LOC114269940 isoform X2 n=1 Tax=Camellia sinensis TaxID=4442 RepID=UPI0010367BE8|nr:uncharacterized protein LOC114269940 isoform X2 [Camellia sinensis]